MSLYFKDITILDENFDSREHMNVLVEGAKITYVGEEGISREGVEIYEGKNKFLMPGFYNLHCHVPMTLLRGHGDSLPLDVWLFENMIPFESKMTDEDIYWSTLHGSMEMIRSGVTSFSDMYFASNKIADAVLESGLKANICYGISSGPEGSTLKDNNGYLQTQRLLSRFSNSENGRIKVDCGLHAEYTSDEPLVREVAEYAKENSLIVHTHISETEKEHEACKAKYGLTPAQYFNKLGLFDSPIILAHGVWFEECDLDILSEIDATVVHNASSNLKLGSGFCRLKDIMDRGIKTAIGTDGAASNNNLNMLEEVHLASMLQKAVSRDPSFMNAKQALKMATLDGAIAQKRPNSGLIKEGYSADIIVFDMDRPHLQPIFDHAANIVFSAEASDIVLNMIDGEIVYKDGIYIGLDADRITFEVKRIKDKIMGSFK